MSLNVVAGGVGVEKYGRMAALCHGGGSEGGLSGEQGRQEKKITSS